MATISYRNERAMKFEKFVFQFLKSVDDPGKRGRGLHNTDIVEIILKKTMNTELRQYVTALKVQFQHFPRPYQKVLQDIASQVPLLANFRQTLEIITTLDNVIEGNCTDTRAHDVE